MSKQKNGISGLHLAALRGDQTMVDLLIKYGAEINAIDYTGSTPFLQSLTYVKTLSIAERLISLGANTSINPFGLYNCIKQLRLKRFNDIPAITSLFNEKITLKWKEVYLRKMCAHVFNIGESSPLVGKNGTIESAALVHEGLYSPAIFLQDIATNTLNHFSKTNTKEQARLARILDEVCQFSSDSSLSNSDYIHRIKSGRPTLISAGYWVHGISILIWGNRFIECNSNHSRMSFHHYNQNLLREDLIGKLRHSRAESLDSYNKLIKACTEDLRFYKTPSDKKLEALYPLPNQDVGNCIWKSFESIVYAVFILYELKSVNNLSYPVASPNTTTCKYNELSDSNLQLIAAFQRKRHFEWLLHQMLHFMNEYVDFHRSKNSPYFPETRLIQWMISKLQAIDLKNYPFLQLDVAASIKKAKSIKENALVNNARLKVPEDEKYDSLFGHGFSWKEEKCNYRKFYTLYLK